MRNTTVELQKGLIMNARQATSSSSRVRNGVTSAVLALVAVMTSVLIAAQTTPAPVHAIAGLTIDVITWDVVGLDSNNEAVGPDTFPIGVHVCNTTGSSITDVFATLSWDSVNSYITNDGAATYDVGTLAASNCADAYFSMKVARNDLARISTRDYHVTATGTGGYTVSTQNRRITVENLVSQNRNQIDRIAGSGGCNVGFTVCDPAPTALTVGNTYTYKLYGNTSTAYEQLEATISFPGTIFTVLSVTGAYEVPNTYSGVSPYADACGWIDDRTGVNFNECGPTIPAAFSGSSGKAGGNVVITYVAKVIAAGSGNLDGLFYDFSGSSFHYNSDFGGGALVAVTATDPGSSPTPSASPSPSGSADPSVSPSPSGSIDPSSSPEASGDGGGVPSTNTDRYGGFGAISLTILAIWLAGFALLVRKRDEGRVSARTKR